MRYIDWHSFKLVLRELRQIYFTGASSEDSLRSLQLEASIRGRFLFDEPLASFISLARHISFAVALFEDLIVVIRGPHIDLRRKALYQVDRSFYLF